MQSSKRFPVQVRLCVCRLFILVLVAVSIGWIPILMANQGGQLWDYLQAMQAYLAPPWVVVFILGISWKRTTEQVGPGGVSHSLWLYVWQTRSAPRGEGGISCVCYTGAVRPQKGL